MNVTGAQSVYERLPSHLLYVGEQLATRAKTDSTIEKDFAAFKAGVTPDELDKQEGLAAMQAAAAELAAQTADLDDTKFNELLQQIEQAQSQPVAPPSTPTLRRPNDLQLGVAGLAALLNPGSALDALSVPLQYGLAEQAKGAQADQQRFERESAEKQQRLGFLGQLLGIEDQRSRQRQDAEERRIGRQFDLTQGNLERLSRESIANQNNEYRVLLEQIKGETKQFQDQVKPALKTYYEGSDLEGRRRAWAELLDLGFDLPEPTEKSAKEKNLDAKTRTVEETRELVKGRLRSQIGLNEANAKKVARVTYWMDAEKQASIAKAWKSIEDMESRITDRAARRDIDWARVTIDSVTKTQTSLNTAMSTLSAQANSERARMKDLENKLYSKQWMLKRKPDGSLDLSDEETLQHANLTNEIAQARQRITDLQTQHGELKGQAAEIRRRAEEAAAGAGYKPADNPGTEKTNRLISQFRSQFPGGRAEQWADRNIAGTNTKSMHASGQAADLYGDLLAIRKWALSNPDVGMVIHDRQIWTRRQDGSWSKRAYSGVHPHDDHVHIEPRRKVYGPPAPPGPKGGSKPSVSELGQKYGF